MQRYVKGLIAQNQRHQDFLERLAKTPDAQVRRSVEEFRREIESTASFGGGGEDGGESTENEEEEAGAGHDDDDQSIDPNISVEVNDL